jgi:hypothetical protein
VKGFGELLSEMIDVTIKRVFGESASELIYSVMERQASLNREEISEKIDDFQVYMRKLVGSEIAQIILVTSLKDLCTRLQREYEEVEKYFSVLDELYEIKFNLLSPSSKEERPVCN